MVGGKGGSYITRDFSQYQIIQGIKVETKEKGNNGYLERVMSYQLEKKNNKRSKLKKNRIEN